MLKLGLSPDEMRGYFSDYDAMLARVSDELVKTCPSQREYCRKFTAASRVAFRETLLNILLANNQRVSRDIEALLQKLQEDQK